MILMRADKLPVSAGVGTRTEVKKVIKAGRFKRDEVSVRNPEEKLDPEAMKFSLDDTPFYLAVNEYWILSKPTGVLNAVEDRRHETVISYMGLQRKDLVPCGRLDIDTEGLLLVIDDGALVHHLLAPSKRVSEQYEVHCTGTLPPDAAAQVAAGITLEDGIRFLPGQLDIGDNPAPLITFEGKFHEVKRMFAVLGCPVEKLRRLSMGPLCPFDLGLKTGELRKLSPAEESSLLALASTGNVAVPFSSEVYDAVILDLDGTLVDSMGYWKEIDYIYPVRFGIEALENLSQLLGGMSIGEVADYFQRHFHIPDSKEKMLRDWEELSMGRYVKDTPLKPGVLPSLRGLRRRKCKLAVATNNVRPMADTVLKAHGIVSYFDAIVVDTDVEKGEPNPEIYLRAAERLDAEPSRCAVFEDLPEGIQAGQCADMRAYTVENSFSEPLRTEKVQLAFAMIKDYRELW